MNRFLLILGIMFFILSMISFAGLISGNPIVSILEPSDGFKLLVASLAAIFFAFKDSPPSSLNFFKKYAGSKQVRLKLILGSFIYILLIALFILDFLYGNTFSLSSDHTLFIWLFIYFFSCLFFVGILVVYDMSPLYSLTVIVPMYLYIKTIINPSKLVLDENAQQIAELDGKKLAWLTETLLARPSAQTLCFKNENISHTNTNTAFTGPIFLF